MPVLRPLPSFLRILFLLAAGGLWPARLAWAQKAPEAGYAFPGGAQAGTTVEVKLGGYDWTPDLQFFVRDPQVQFKQLTPPGELLITPPPYWFGPKGKIAGLPLPREITAQFTIPADHPEGPVEWQVANAGGGSAPAVFWVSHFPEILEVEQRKTPQALSGLPVVVNGRISKIEEVDRYTLTVPKPTLVTCELFSRRLGSKMNGSLEIREAAGRLIADAVDTAGQDTELTFAALPGKTYVLSVHDLDFNGDWSFVYRLRLTTGPRVLGTLPAGGKRGETRPVQFIGRGLATGGDQLERVTATVSFPAEPGVSSFDYRLDTPQGPAQSVELLVSDLVEEIEPSRNAPETIVPLSVPGAVTGLVSQRGEVDRYSVTGKKGDVWDISLTGRQSSVPFDAVLAILGADGKELARNDDAATQTAPVAGKRRARVKRRSGPPPSTDAALSFTLPADGTYTLAVSDLSSRGGSSTSVYRLTVVIPKSAPVPPPDFTFEVPKQLNLPLAGKSSLPVKINRSRGFTGTVQLALSGLPGGVTTPTKLVIPENKSDLAVELVCAPNAAAEAALLRLQATAQQGATSLAEQAPPVLLAVTLKPRCYISPLVKDGSRTVHRGTTFPAPIIVKWLEGYTGDVILQMSSRQSYQVQGLRGEDVVVPHGVSQPNFNIHLPEWLAIDSTTRMILIGVCKVADGQGKLRYVVSPMDGRITMSPEGSLLRIIRNDEELIVRPGATLEIPLQLFRSPKLQLPVKLELIVGSDLRNLLKAEVVNVPLEQSKTQFRIVTENSLKLLGDQTVKIRATAYEAPHLPVVSEVDIPIEFVAR